MPGSWTEKGYKQLVKRPNDLDAELKKDPDSYARENFASFGLLVWTPEKRQQAISKAPHLADLWKREDLL